MECIKLEIVPKRRIRQVSESRVDHFHDGELTPSQREEFLHQLEGDPALRAQVECQKWIDQSIRQWSADSKVDHLLPRIEEALAGQRYQSTAWRQIVRILGAAALVVFSMAGLWYSWKTTRPQPIVDVYQPQPWRNFATVYYDTIRDGFKPAWICRNEKQFETAFSRNLRQPLLLATLPSGVTAGGISYSNSLTPATINVLGRVNGTPVMVFVDRLAAEVTPLPPPPPELHLFRREIDALVLYELTPLDRPEILPFFYNPNKK